MVGDYYLVVGDDELEEDQPIGIWGQRHLRHLKRRHKVIYANLLTSGKLPEYLADIDRQAEELFLRLAKQTADAEGITEKLKASNEGRTYFAKWLLKHSEYEAHSTPESG